MTGARVIDPGPFTGAQDVASRTGQFVEIDGSPMAEFVRWLAPLSSRVMLNKDGSMLAAIVFDGLDIDSSSDDKMNALRSQVLYALQQLGRTAPVLGWHVRRRVTTLFPQGKHPDPITQRMQQLQNEQFLEEVQYTNQHVLTFSLLPRSGASRLVSAIRRSQDEGGGWFESLKAAFGAAGQVIKGEAEFPYRDAREIEDDLEVFEKLLDTLVSACGGLSARILHDDELGGFLQRCVQPTLGLDSRCPMPPNHALADETIPVGWVDNSYEDVLVFKHNDKRVYASCYSLDLRLIEKLSFDLLDRIMGAPFECTLTHTFKTLERGKAKSQVSAIEAYHSNRKYSIKTILAAALGKGDLDGSHVKEGRRVAAEEATAIKDMVDDGEIALGEYYGTLMVQAQTLEALDQARRSAEEILQAARLQPRLEGLHKFSSYCSTIPGSHEEVARWLKIDQTNFIDLGPVRTISAGSFMNEDLSSKMGAQCSALMAFSTRSRTPFYYTGYSGELGHELIIGPSRTGKTALSTVLWSQFRKYPGSRVVIFDKDYSCRPAVYLQGGRYIDLSPEKNTGQHLSPIAALLKDGSLKHITFVASWVEMLARSRSYEPTSDDRRKLEDALKATAIAGQSNPALLRLGSVVSRLDLSTEFARALQMWVGEAAYGKFFDHPQDDFDLTTLVGVEMGSILTDDELAGPFMAYAFYRISSHLRQLGADDKPVPTLIYVPEAWFFLKNPVFAAQLDNWLVTLAKLGARVCFDTQTPDKLVQSPAFPSFRDNIPSLIFTPNERARTKSLYRMYVEEWGLNEEELAFIVNGLPRQDYYIRQGQISRRVQFAMPPELVAMVRSDQRAQMLLAQFIDQGLPPGWQRDYIQQLLSERKAS